VTLATHTIIGIGLATLLPPGPWQPVAVFGLALAGHYASDMIPHWDYIPPFLVIDEENKLNTRMIGGGKFVAGLLMVGAEFLLGALVGIVIFFDPSQMTIPVLLASVVGSILPDVLQPLYYIFRREPFTSIQKFHDFFHADRRLREQVGGIICQAIVVLIFVAVVLNLR